MKSMRDFSGYRRAGRHRARAVYRRWQADLRGASLVQFIFVVPIFILIIMGLYGVFTVMAARDTLCEATYQAARYLQVEGPHFPPDDIAYAYPDGWAREAVDIINQELASRTHTELYPVLPSDVVLDPASIRNSPRDTTEVRDNPIGVVENAWFTIKVSRVITSPLGSLLGSDPALGTMKLTCKSTGFFEGPPIGPTRPGQGGGPNRCPRPVVQCRPCPGCTATPEDPRTPTVCPVCRP